MADFVSNQALGRVVEFYNNVDNNTPANSALIIVPFDAGATGDEALRDADTLAAVLALVTERSTNGWNRKTITDADISPYSVDDTNNRIELVVADQTWTPTSGAVTDVVIGYDSDTTAGTDTNIIPVSFHDFIINPDGSLVTLDVPATGFFRAQG